MDEKRVYRAALEKWGADAQTLMAFEEMAELQKELCKHARGKDNAGEIAEEIADVEIMLGQMKILHGCAEMSAGYKRQKLERLVERCGLEAEPQEGQHMKFQDGRVKQGTGVEQEPVKLGPGVSLRLEKTSVSAPHNTPGTANTTAAWKVLQALGYVNDTPFKETQDFLRKVRKILEILEQSGINPEYWGGVIGTAAAFDIHMRG